MKNLSLLGLCLLLSFFSCGKKSCENSDSAAGAEKKAMSDTAMIAEGIVGEGSSMNVLSIITATGDTMVFGTEDAVFEGSGLLIGDSATVYYTLDSAAASMQIPMAEKIIIKQAVITPCP